MPRVAPVLLLLSIISAVPAQAEPALPQAGTPESLCRPAIVAAERAHAIPMGLMAAIGRTESGRRDTLTGTWNPWPWTVNAEGQGSYYDTKAQAMAAVRAMQARGVRSIDVGCMQVNLMHHPDAFPSLEQAFDPRVNADYAGQFLTQLFGQTNAWPQAVARYHSATPELGSDYQRKVMAIWPEEQRQQAAGPSALANAWAATLNRSFVPPFTRGQAARIIPLTAPAGGAAPPGRTLDAYRAMPVLVASRPIIRRGG